MPRRRKKSVIRLSLSAEEIESRIMALVGKGGGRRSIRGITIVYVGSLGTEPNWFARPRPPKISPESMKRFVTALAQVRKEFDLLVDLHAGDDLSQSLMAAWKRIPEPVFSLPHTKGIKEQNEGVPRVRMPRASFEC